MNAPKKVVFSPYVVETESYLTASGNFTRTRGCAVRFTSIDDAAAFASRAAVGNILTHAQILISAWKE